MKQCKLSLRNLPTEGKEKVHQMSILLPVRASQMQFKLSSKEPKFLKLVLSTGVNSIPITSGAEFDVTL